MARRPTRLLLAAAVTLVAMLAAACGDSGGSTPAAASGGSTPSAPTTIRLGYFPNLTHASAIVGVEKGFFAQALGTDTLETKTFNAGPAAVESLFSGAIDAAYLGPNPAINAWAKSKGEAIRIISGATSGGALLVVKPEINAAADLKRKKVASPQLGGTQDVALRWWLKDAGLRTDSQGGGDVGIVPQENAQTLDAFKANQISGAWVPEPWATRLVQEGGGKVLVDEKTLWPGAKFVTTHLIVSTDFLKKHPDTVRRLLAGQVAADDFIAKNPDEAQKVTNDGIAKLSGKPIAAGVIAAAWKNLTFTNDPIASSLRTSADHAIAVGLLEPVKLDGIYDLTLLNEVLAKAGKPKVGS